MLVADIVLEFGPGVLQDGAGSSSAEMKEAARSTEKPVTSVRASGKVAKVWLP